MTSAPTGTVTFLFTDVEGSTRLWEEQPDAASLMMKRHDELIESVVDRHGGFVVRPRGEGDSRFCVFARASDGVAAAIAIQVALAEEAWEVPLSVRVAVHTGEAELRDGDYFGPAVNRCARLRAIAHGGQILLSAATEELVNESLPAGTSTLDLGPHRLRDLSAPLRVFQLRHPALRAEFPPLVSLDAVSNNLPVQLTSFVGREAEIAEIRKLLEVNRLVTLTGAAGCGKTRHALQTAAELLDAFLDGAWFVDLAPIADPALVPQAIARALGSQEEAGKPLMDTVLDSLRARRALIVLDNCEHLLAASAKAATEILLACPDVSLLATARESLGIGGETSWRVPSLSLPEEADGLEALATSEAAQLFVDRARSASGALTLTDEDAPAVAKICARLDGIPLAIELAAARAGVLAPDEIASRLDDHLRLLTGGSRNALERQQTLRAAVDWSHALLTEPEKVLLRRLSVFSGGFTLEACEDVCSDGEVTREGVLDLLSALVSKSLVVATRSGRATRYRLLETMRQYAREKLVDSSDGSETRARHVTWCREFVRKAEPEFHGPRQVEWFERVAEEHDNIRSALGWAIDCGDAGSALALVDDVAYFWDVRGHWMEAGRWIGEALAVPGERDAARGRVLAWAGGFAWLDDMDAGERFTREAMAIGEAVGDGATLAWGFSRLGAIASVRGHREEAIEAFDRGEQIAEEVGDRKIVAVLLVRRARVLRDLAGSGLMLERALAMARELGDGVLIGSILTNLGGHAGMVGDYPRARVLLQEALELVRPTGHKVNIATVTASLAGVDFLQGDYVSARRLFEEADALARDLGGTMAEISTLSTKAVCAFMDGEFSTAADTHGRVVERMHQLGAKGAEAWNLFLAGNATLLDGRPAEARVLLEASIAMFRELDDPRVGVPMGELGRLEAAEGNVDLGRGLLRDALRMARMRGIPLQCTGLIERLAAVEAVAGGGERAALLLGAAEASRERLGCPISPSARRWHTEAVARARSACSEASFDVAWSRGRALALEDAVTYALEEIPDAEPV